MRSHQPILRRLLAGLACPFLFSACQTPDAVTTAPEVISPQRVPEPEYVAPLRQIVVGATTAQVRATQGEPMEIVRNPLSDAEVWIYGADRSSTVHFVAGAVDAWEDPARRLRVRYPYSDFRAAAEDDARTGRRTSSASSSRRTETKQGVPRRTDPYIDPTIDPE